MPDGPITVLIVDDDFRVAEIHKGFVEEVDGFEVVGSVQSAARAVELCVELSPALVLLDIYLPDGSGTEVLRCLRDELSIDCFVLTAARDVATVKRCLDLGALHYLVKPFARDELTDRLQEYRRWRQSLRVDGELDQPDIDQIFNGRGRPHATLPKGLSAETMALVQSALAGADDAIGAEDVAQLTGISRVSVRRYLRHLADSGEAELVPDYGTPGRPRHRFRLVS
ncbi:MAG: response regulator [Actinomycetota bacterium]